MSAIGVACIAAVMAGVVWYERWVVRRNAVHRGLARRRAAVWAGAEVLAPPDKPSRRLVLGIERAVFAGDLAASYEERWREESKRGESPFQLKRARMEAATRVYSEALDAVERLAMSWVGDDPQAHRLGRQRQGAVQRLLDHLEGRHRDGDLSDLTALDPTIDALENAAANLRRPKPTAGDPHPFRG